jgi:hypothetical protein
MSTYKEITVDTAQVLDALVREKELLREFHDISMQQLRLLDNENLDGMQEFLDTRSDLMLELTAIETTLGTWIGQIRNDSTVTADVLRELRYANDDIVCLANEIVELDEQVHWHLDLIREQSARELCEVNRGYGAMTGYGATLHASPAMDMRR